MFVEDLAYAKHGPNHQGDGGHKEKSLPPLKNLKVYWAEKWVTTLQDHIDAGTRAMGHQRGRKQHL